MESNTNYANENCKDDPMPFVSIAAATANALRFLKLDEKQDEEASHNGERSRGDQENSGSNCRYIDQRLNKRTTRSGQVG